MSEPVKREAFNFQQSAVERAKEARMKGFGQAKVMDEHNVGHILQGLADIGDDMKNHYPRIPESTFKNRFLDAFAGFGKSPEDNYSVYLEWVQDIAKQFNIPVHVCSDTDMGEILFTVPAVCNVTTINPQKVRNEEVQHAISTATQARVMQPYQWEAMLSQNLLGIYSKVYDSANAVTGDQKVWESIFDRYKDHFAGRTQLGGFNQDLMIPSDTKHPSNKEGDANVSPTTQAETPYVEYNEDD